MSFSGSSAASSMAPVPEASPEDQHTDDAEAVEVGKEAVEKVVWTTVANGHLLRTRYELPDSGLSEDEIDASIALYYAAPLRELDGVWYPAVKGIAYIGQWGSSARGRGSNDGA